MEVAKFSPSGEYLGVSGADGRLKIWDAGTSVLKQEFVPSSHLTATCTCIEWSPSSQTSAGKKKRKRLLAGGDVVAMGTGTGSLLFYGVSKASLLSQHKDAHAGRVTGLSWSANTLLLYSVGEDGFIQEWDVETGKFTSRWRGNKSGLTCCRTFQSGLLTAGHGITFWSLDTKTPLKSFTGHPSLISQLEVIPSTDYFVSMCQTERHLRIWSSQEKNSVLTLTVPEPPAMFSVCSSSKSPQVSVAVVTGKGPLHIFQHKLNGPVKKPLLPSVTLKVIDALEETSTLPILASWISDEGLLTAYGANWLRLRFEKFMVSNLEVDTVIKREYATQKKKGKRNQPLHQLPDSQVDVPVNVKHLPGGGAAGGLEGISGKKRKKPGAAEMEEGIVEDGELPMEERLTNLTIEGGGGAAGAGGGGALNSNNLANLLSQGLHSKDVRILQSVLSRWDENVIAATVRSLPVQLIVPLLQEIRGMLGGKAQQNHSLLKWLKNIFQIHSAYLMSCPSGEELLGPFLNLLKSREALYPQMCQLKGKLQLIKGNIQAKEFKAEQPNEALLVYQDESSDEDREDDAFLPSESEGLAESDDDLGVDDDDDSDQNDASDDEMEEDEEDGDADSQADSDSSEEEVANGKKKKAVNNHVTKTNNAVDSDDLMDDDDDDD